MSINIDINTNSSSLGFSDYATRLAMRQTLSERKLQEDLKRRATRSAAANLAARSSQIAFEEAQGSKLERTRERPGARRLTANEVFVCFSKLEPGSGVRVYSSDFTQSILLPNAGSQFEDPPTSRPSVIFPTLTGDCIFRDTTDPGEPQEFKDNLYEDFPSGFFPNIGVTESLDEYGNVISVLTCPPESEIETRAGQHDGKAYQRITNRSINSAAMSLVLPIDGAKCLFVSHSISEAAWTTAVIETHSYLQYASTVIFSLAGTPLFRYVLDLYSYAASVVVQNIDSYIQSNIEIRVACVGTSSVKEIANIPTSLEQRLKRFLASAEYSTQNVLLQPSRFLNRNGLHVYNGPSILLNPLYGFQFKSPTESTIQEPPPVSFPYVSGKPFEETNPLLAYLIDTEKLFSYNISAQEESPPPQLAHSASVYAALLDEQPVSSYPGYDSSALPSFYSSLPPGVPQGIEYNISKEQNPETNESVINVTFRSPTIKPVSALIPGEIANSIDTGSVILSWNLANEQYCRSSALALGFTEEDLDPQTQST